MKRALCGFVCLLLAGGLVSCASASPDGGDASPVPLSSIPALPSGSSASAETPESALPSPPVPAASPTPTPTPLPNGPVKSVVVQEEYWTRTPEESPSLLTATAAFPLIEAQNRAELTAVNELLLREREAFLLHCEQLLANLRLDGRDGGEPAVCSLGFSVEFNDEGLLSLRHERYEYTGGAHGTSAMSCSTYDLNTGQRLTLSHFLPSPDGLRLLAGAVAAQCAQRLEDFFPDAAALVWDFLPHESFCITPEGIALFYPELTIAPLMAGVVRFDVLWKDLEA